MTTRSLALVFAGLLAIVAAIELVPLAIGCDIKGNISVGKGERIYHVRGQRYYWQTRINPFRGERWFCSEGAARAAGWRKSRV